MRLHFRRTVVLKMATKHIWARIKQIKMCTHPLWIASQTKHNCTKLQHKYVGRVCSVVEYHTQRRSLYIYTKHTNELIGVDGSSASDITLQGRVQLQSN